jgi:hypothetical protein
VTFKVKEKRDMKKSSRNLNSFVAVEVQSRIWRNTISAELKMLYRFI